MNVYCWPLNKKWGIAENFTILLMIYGREKLECKLHILSSSWTYFLGGPWTPLPRRRRALMGEDWPYKYSISQWLLYIQIYSCPNMRVIQTANRLHDIYPASARMPYITQAGQNEFHDYRSCKFTMLVVLVWIKLSLIMEVKVNLHQMVQNIASDCT